MKKALAKVEPAPVGRPSKYDPAFVGLAHEACMAGATDEELADYLGIATSTLYEWKKAHPEFSEAIKSGKAPADAKVAAALYERALGAEWVEEQAIKVKRVEYNNGKRVLETESVEVVEVTRRAPPDTTAGIFWLKNRRPRHWSGSGSPDDGPSQVMDQARAAEVLAQIETMRSVRQIEKLLTTAANGNGSAPVE